MLSHLVVDLVAHGEQTDVDTIPDRGDVLDAAASIWERLHVRTNNRAVDSPAQFGRQSKEIEGFAVTFPPVLLVYEAVG